MITFEEACAAVQSTAISLPTERIGLADSLNRVLAEDVCSDVDMPPFNKSAMDGYACRRDDLKLALEVIEEIPAGYVPQELIGPGQCAKIMTGAVVPEGADCVIMVEYTEVTEEGKVRFTKDDTKSNICLKAEDIQAGDVVLQKGTLVRPSEIAVMATVGCANPLVSVRPRVGIIATGSELVNPDEPVSGAKIRNSNGWQLTAQASEIGMSVTNYGIAVDTERDLSRAIDKALAENDVVILSGGVSMGDFDLVPGVLKKNGVQIEFNKVAIQPGNPSTFGVRGNVRCFGLPGNPVSTFVQFEFLIKPFLYKMMGCDFSHKIVPAELAEDIKRRKTVRASILPVRYCAPGKVEKIEYHGSAHISAMCKADGVIIVPVGQAIVEAGAIVDVRLL